MAQMPLGRLFDIAPVIVPVTNTTGSTGLRVHVKDCGGVLFVVFCSAGTAGDDLDIDLQEHTASTGGTSQDLDIIDTYYLKTETTLDNDEQWTAYTQTAASEINDAGGAGTSAEEQNLLAFYVPSTALSDGYEWLSINTTNFGAADDKIESCLALLTDLQQQRAPDNLPAPQ